MTLTRCKLTRAREVVTEKVKDYFNDLAIFAEHKNVFVTLSCAIIPSKKHTHEPVTTTVNERTKRFTNSEWRKWKIDIDGAPKKGSTFCNEYFMETRTALPHWMDFHLPLGVIKFTFHRSNSKHDKGNEEGTQTVSREGVAETNCYDFRAMMSLNDFHRPTNSSKPLHVLQHHQNNIVMHKLRKLLQCAHFSSRWTKKHLQSCRRLFKCTLLSSFLTYSLRLCRVFYSKDKNCFAYQV